MADVCVEGHKLGRDEGLLSNCCVVVVFFFRNEAERVADKDEGGGTDVRRKAKKELRLFVRYRNLSTSQQDLKEYFSRYGNVGSVVLMRERESKMPRGTAFVEMSTPQEVEAVLEARPHQVGGESMVVRPAYPRTPR